MSSENNSNKQAEENNNSPEEKLNQNPTAEGAVEKPEEQVEYSVSAGLVARLAKLNISFAFTSYQSGLMYLIGRNKENGINIHQAGLPKPMGLCMDDNGGLTMTGGYQIMRFENILEPEQRINHSFDACYVPRTVHVTGHLDAHDVGIGSDGNVVFVNTRYNCLATVSPKYSFEMLWKPPFISALVDEDRCHLNGLAMENGKPRYVTAVSRSNTIDGWRDRRADGGIVIDVDSNEIICTGLSMPHSPRMHNGQLWLLNSGSGELGMVEIDENGEGSFQPKVFCPGFLRGLAFYGNYAFVGLSKPRYKRFEGLPLDKKLEDADSDPWCGVQIIDLTTGACVDWFRIDGKIAELYDLEVIPGVATPMAVPPESNEAASLIALAPRD
ncbi:MAG: TIGR03032 family protein [Proteobacteria bacterium]|nr:TIGR03032 family protein [Pseudomonadota bacterium]